MFGTHEFIRNRLEIKLLSYLSEQEEETLTYMFCFLYNCGRGKGRNGDDMTGVPSGIILIYVL